MLGKGSLHPKTHLTENDIQTIVDLLKEGYRREDIAEMYQTTVENLYNISSGKSWTHVTEGKFNVPRKVHPSTKVHSPELVLEIFRLNYAGHTYMQIKEKLGLSLCVISKLMNLKYTLKYEKGERDQIRAAWLKKALRRAIYCLETKEVYESQTSASKALGILRSQINRELNRLKPNPSGYNFKYVLCCSKKIQDQAKDYFKPFLDEKFNGGEK